MGTRSFRIARSTDEFTLTRLQVDILPSDVPLSPSKGVWWVVWEGPEAVGFACFLPTKADPTWGYLARAGVLPSARGLGLQRRLIRVREAYAKRSLYKVLVTDTSNINVASSNSLIACGYKLYTPHTRWGFATGNYWRKTL